MAEQIGSFRTTTLLVNDNVTYNLQVDAINRLKIIHVAGTKGKGSTCAFIECLLRSHGLNTGLYTGPPLTGPEERIRIGFLPLEKERFAGYVYHVLDTLRHEHPTPKYLQLLTLVSFHAFIEANVDVAIYETHHGGRNDATNFIPRPTVTAITVIDYDHTDSLGKNIERIAWHKAGIIKHDAPAFSVLQQPVVARVLEDEAAEKGVRLNIIPPLSELPAHAPRPQPEVQLQNFSLAYAVCNSFLERTRGHSLTPNVVEEGLRRFDWPGRFQIIPNGTITWFLDGAHNELSLKTCGEWFAQNSQNSGYDRVWFLWSRLLTFQACIKSSYLVTSLLIGIQYLSVDRWLNRLKKQMFKMSSLLFVLLLLNAMVCPYLRMQELSNGIVDLTQDNLSSYQEAWKKMSNSFAIHTTVNLPAAIGLAARLGATNALITGSLHLVGSALEILQPRSA